jgi:hypothetical protein
MLEVIVVETLKQHVGVRVTQSFGVGITITRVEMVVALNINVVRREGLIGSTTKLGSGSNGVSTIRNLNRSSALPTIFTRVVGILQMVFTNLIMTTHVNRIADRPLMSSMVVGGYRSANVVHPRRGYRNQLL